MKIKREIKSMMVYLGCVGLAMMAVVAVGRKNGMSAQKSIANNDVFIEAMDYGGLWNQQGTMEGSGRQVFIANRGIVLSSLYGNMYLFDESSRDFTFFCEKSGCSHLEGSCPGRLTLSHMVRCGTALYGVPWLSSRNEIWKVQDDEVTGWFRADEDICGLWGYREYLYYMTDSGVFRVSADNPAQHEQILDKPVLVCYLTFYKDKMYFVTEDRFLFEALLDGSERKRVVDEKALSPQICDGFLYYRSDEYDENGVFQAANTLKRVSLEDGSVEKVLDAVYMFAVVPEEKKIYYTDLPDLSESRESFLNVFDIASGKVQRLTECAASAQISVFPESEWIVFEMPEGEYDLYYCCIKKDGTDMKRVSYPEGLEE